MCVELSNLVGHERVHGNITARFFVPSIVPCGAVPERRVFPLWCKVSGFCVPYWCLVSSKHAKGAEVGDLDETMTRNSQRRALKLQNNGTICRTDTGLRMNSFQDLLYPTLAKRSLRTRHFINDTYGNIFIGVFLLRVDSTVQHNMRMEVCRDVSHGSPLVHVLKVALAIH